MASSENEVESTVNDNSSCKMELPDQEIVLTEGTERIYSTPTTPVINSVKIQEDSAKKSNEVNPENEVDQKNEDNTNNNNDLGEQTAEGPVYIQPEEKPYRRAVNYLEEHHIMHIFQHLTSGIVYEKPDDPLQYMVDELERMKIKKQEEGARFPGS